MGYEVSLRHSEADQIEVLSDVKTHSVGNEEEQEDYQVEMDSTTDDSTDKELTPEKQSDAVRRKSHTINVAHCR